MEAGSAVTQIDGEHRTRARSLSDLYTKLLVKRRMSGPPKNMDEYLQDLDIVCRAAEHVGACKGLNELRILLWPDDAVPAVPALPPNGK